jgi:hypothetical protein
VGRLLAAEIRTLVTFHSQSVGGRVQQFEQGIGCRCNLENVEGPKVLRNRVWITGSGVSNRSGDGIEKFDLVHDGTGSDACPTMLLYRQALEISRREPWPHSEANGRKHEPRRRPRCARFRRGFGLRTSDLKSDWQRAASSALFQF